MSIPRVDVDSALAELQHLISSVASGGGSNMDATLITQRLRSLERELRADSGNRAPSSVVSSPSPRRQHSLPQPIPDAALLHSPLSRRAIVAPEPSVHTLRQSVSMLKESVPRVTIDVMNGKPPGPFAAEDKWPLSRGATSSREVSSAALSTSHQSAAVPSSNTPVTARLINRSNKLDVSFAQQYASDDNQRLRFVIDAVSNQLQKERRWRRQLQRNVVPTLLDRIEQLENEGKQLRQEIAASQHEILALRMQQAVAGRPEMSNRVEECLERVTHLLEKVAR